MGQEQRGLTIRSTGRYTACRRMALHFIMGQAPSICSAPVSSNVRQRRTHTFRVLYGRSKCFARSCMQASLMTPLHFGQCPNTLMALCVGALRRAVSFGRWCLTPSRPTSLHSNSYEVGSQRLCQSTAVGCRFAPACCAAQSIGQLPLSSTLGAPAYSAALAKSVPHN